MRTLNVGMLWFDGDESTSLAARLERAADHYREKYGVAPNLCLVHPETAGEDRPNRCGGVAVETSEQVLPEHLWLGVAQEAERAPAAA
ncbi:MAG: hypothetical protein R3191_05170 [Anaerolineales bacterium]|nr:hypothetical protein [Anaerolineales bacterium]